MPSKIKILMGIVAGRAIHRPENAPSDVFTSAQSSAALPYLALRVQKPQGDQPPWCSLAPVNRAPGFG